MSFPASEMRETVSIKARSGSGAYGPIFGSAYTELWYCEPGFKRIADAKGNEVVSSLFALAPKSSTIAVGDEVTWEARRYEVIDAQPMRPRGIVSHVEVYLKSAGVLT